MTNPIVSANAGSQPDDSIDVPEIKPNPFMEASPEAPPLMNPMGNVNPGANAEPITATETEPTPTPTPTTPMQPVFDMPQNMESVFQKNPELFREGVEEQLSGLDDITQMMKPRPLPTDIQLPGLYEGKPEQATAFLNRFGQLNQEITQQQQQQEQASQSQWSQEALRKLAQMNGQEKTNSFWQFLIGDNKYDDFDPIKGKWGDYGGGALGAGIFLLGQIGKPFQAARGATLDAIRFGRAYGQTTQQQGFNPFETSRLLIGGVNPLMSTGLGKMADFLGQRGFNPFSAEWRNTFRKNLESDAPDPTAARFNPSRSSYALAPIFNPGRDISFSNWSKDLRGRNNPLGFLYGDKKTEDGKLNWGKGLSALALDIITDPTNLIRKPIKKVTQEAIKETAEQAARRRGRDVLIGASESINRPFELQLPNNTVWQRGTAPVAQGVMKRPGMPDIPLGVSPSIPKGTSVVRPASVVKKYREYQRRLALPPAPEGAPGSIDAAYSVVSSKPDIPTIRSVAEQLRNNPSREVLEVAAKQFDDIVKTISFPKGAMAVELDELIDRISLAKTPRGVEAAKRIFDRRIDKLEKKWLENQPKPKPTPDMSRFDYEPYRDSLLRGQSEQKLLPEVSGRLNSVLKESTSIPLVRNADGVFIPATKEVLSEMSRGGKRIVDTWRRAALPSMSQRTARMGVLDTTNRFEITGDFDEGVRQFRRESTQPVLPPAINDYADYSVSPKVYLNDADLNAARQTFVDANPKNTGKRVFMKAWLDEGLKPSEVNNPQPVRLWAALEDESNVILPVIDLEAASKSLTLESPSLTSQRALRSLLDGSRVTFDGVTTMNASEVSESVLRQGMLPPALPNNTAIPISVFKPQTQVDDMLGDAKFIDPYSVENMTPRDIGDLNVLVKWLPSPDGYRLLDREYETYEGLVSAIQRRLTGQPREVIENYLSTVKRFGERVRDMNADEIEVLLRRQASDSTPSLTAFTRQLDDLPRLPYAEVDGVGDLSQVGKALDDGLDPNRILDNLVEPDLKNPTVRANILKNMPDEFAGITPQTKDLSITRVSQERVLNELTDTRKEIEATKDLVETKLEDLLDEIETLPDIGMKPLPGTAFMDVKQLMDSKEPPINVGRVLPELQRRSLPDLRKPLPDLNEIDPSDGFVNPPDINKDAYVDKFSQLFDDIDSLTEGVESKLPPMSEMFKMSKDELQALSDDFYKSFDDDLRVMDEAIDSVKKVLKDYDDIWADNDYLMSDPELANIIRPGRLGTPSYYHGTRVSNLDLSKADPIDGGARGEFGTALYLTKNHIRAEAHAMADVSPNLPVVESRQFGDGFVHEVGYTGRITLKADAEADKLFKDNVMLALTSVSSPLDPVHTKLIKSFKASLSRSKNITVEQVYEKMTSSLDKVMKANPTYSGVDEEFLLNWQRALNLRLRQAGIDAIESGDTLAVINPQAIKGRAIKPFGNEIESPLSVAVSRYNALGFAVRNNPDNKFLQVQRKEAQAAMLTRLSDRLQTHLDETDERIIKQLNDMLDYDESLRNIVEAERSQLKQRISDALEQSDSATLKPTPFKNTPCL